MYTPKSVRDANTSFTSASARAVASAAARRRSGVLSTAKRSPFATPGRSTPVNRSLQTSQLLETIGQNSLESYGAPLPALVREALTFADRNVEMTAVLSPSGWAWLVYGRRLLIWHYRSDDNKKAVNNQFRELTLPPSDLAHQAQLVVVYSVIDGQAPSCVTISPEGFVRFWPSITHEGSYIEVGTDLQGQECDSLVFLGPSLGCLLATTTSTTLLIQPSGGSANNGARQINVRHLKVPAGILGGISRRVSSLVFGSLPTQAPEARLVRVLSIEGQDEDKSVIVLSARALQKWHLMPGEPDKLLYELNVDKFINDGFVDHVWGHDRVGRVCLQVWLVDMQVIQNTSSVMILAAAVNPQISQQLVYALVTLDVGSTVPPTSITNFSVLKHSEYYQESAESVFLSQKFLLCGNTAYIYNKNSVLCVTGDGDSGDRVEFSGSGDFILGAGRSQGLPIFFSSNLGIVSIPSATSNLHNQSNVILDESLALDETSKILSESINLSFAGLETITHSTDHVSRLKAAFLHYNRSNQVQAQLILDELFPGGDDSLLDATVAKLSMTLLDDSPAADPRWAESAQGAGGAGAPMSLIILNQLKDKSMAHRLFVTFVQQIGLWDRLDVATVNKNEILTKFLLNEHAEKLAFAITLRSNHQDHQALVDAAIKFVLDERGEEPSDKLTYADLFYTKVTSIQEIVWGLTKAQDEVITADIAPRDAAATIYSLTSLLLGLLKAAKDNKNIRVLHTQGSTSISPSNTQLEYVPWTSSIGYNGLRTMLIAQHETIVQVGLSRAEDGTTRSKLYSQLVDLTDEILTGYQPHLQSLVNVSPSLHQSLQSKYEKDRFDLIRPLVTGNQYDQAVSLAEKYCDFRTLVMICDETDNQQRLNQYMTQFGSQGFSDFVFRWYLENGKRGKLLSHSGGDLARFLQDYSSLAWLHQINSRDFAQARNTLEQLALDETSYLGRKKTLLSLSKLCKLASSDTNTINADEETEQDPISNEEDLILFQEQLPESVLKAHSLNAETMRVLSPIELIHLYIGEENTYANEYDFKKAIDLLTYVQNNEDCIKLKKEIWIKALKRNSWDNLDTDNPVDSISDTIFFKTIDLAFTQGCDVKELLLPAEELLNADDLGDLRTDATFKFFIHAGYEKISQLI